MRAHSQRPTISLPLILTSLCLYAFVLPPGTREHTRTQGAKAHFQSNKPPGMFHTSFYDLSASRLPLPFRTKCFFEVSPSSCRGHLYLNVIDSGGGAIEGLPVRRCWLLPCVTLPLWTRLAGTLQCSWIKGSQANMHQFGSSGGKK